MGSNSSKLAAAKAVNESAGSLKGRAAVVVGGTAGIGKAVAVRLAKQGADVAIIGRNAERGQEVVREMSQVCGGVGKHVFVKGDAMLMKSVDQSSKEAVQALGTDRLDYLVFCQAIASMSGRTLTEEGIDQKLALHFYSRLRYIQNYLPLMHATAKRDDGKGDPRVLWVLSGGVHKPYAEYKEDPGLEKNFSLKNAADWCGFYTDLALDTLATENPDVTFVHAAPGFVDTNWGTELPAYVRGPIRVLQATAAKSATSCAEWMCTGLLDPKQKGGFRLIDQYGMPAAKTALHTPEVRDFVWKYVNEFLDKQAPRGQDDDHKEPAPSF